MERGMLTTLEVCYEFYLRGFQFDRMDLYQSWTLHFTVDEERGALRPPFVSVAGLGRLPPSPWRNSGRGSRSSR